MQQVTLLHVIRPYGNVFMQKYAVRRRTFITQTVLSSESCAPDYTAEKRRKKHLQFTAARPPCWVCMCSINPFAVGKYYTVNTLRNRETNMLNIHIRGSNQSPMEHFVSFFPVLTVAFSCLAFSTCVICQSLISMSWRHLYSRQTQGGMCWWLSAAAIYHLSSFCPLRR